MRTLVNKSTPLALCVILVCTACGSDEDSSPVAAVNEDAVITGEVVLLFGTLLQSFNEVFTGVVLIKANNLDTETLDGPNGGQVRLSGDKWIMEDYSPAEGLALNGTLTVPIDASNVASGIPPFPVTGTVNVVGVTTTEIGLDIVVTVDGADLSSTGTVSINGIVFDATELFAAVNAAQAAAAGG